MTSYKLRKIGMNKKADATDIIFFVIIFFFLAVSFIVALFANTKIRDVISGTVLNQSAAAQDIIAGLDNVNLVVAQRGYVLMFALFIIGMMVSAFLVRVHPIFMFLYIITLAFAIFLAVYLTNTYQAIIEADAFASIAAQQTMITYIMHNSIKILVGVGAITMIITFAKLSGGGGGGGQL